MVNYFQARKNFEWVSFFSLWIPINVSFIEVCNVTIVLKQSFKDFSRWGRIVSVLYFNRCRFLFLHLVLFLKKRPISKFSHFFTFDSFEALCSYIGHKSCITVLCCSLSDYLMKIFPLLDPVVRCFDFPFRGLDTLVCIKRIFQL